MKLIKITAIRAELNEKGQELVNSFQDYLSGEETDANTGWTREKMEYLNIEFTPKEISNSFEVNNDGQLVLQDNHFDYIKYKLEFPTFSHIEQEDKSYVLVTLDGSRHIISKKTYKKLKKGNPKTK